MKKAIARYTALAVAGVVLLSSCVPVKQGGSSSSVDVTMQADTPASSSQAPAETIDSLLQSSYPIVPINIDKIAEATVINAAWGDEESIYFVARTFPHEQVYKEDWSAYPVEVYHYNNKTNELVKIFEYFSDFYYPYLYIQVQDNGDIALKYSKGFFVISSKDYNVVSEITMPEEGYYIDCNISYDGTKIAVANKDNTVAILDTATLLPINHVQIPRAAFIQAPTWSRDNKNIFVFAPTAEFVDLTYRYNIETQKLQEFDFSENLSTYDNDAFLLSGGNTAARMDYFTVETTDDNIGVQKYNFDSKESSFWLMGDYYFPSCKSISEKGYLVAQAFEEYHQLYVANINTERMVTTEYAKKGGSKYPPVWAKDQERAIVLLTMENQSPTWAAAMVNCPAVLAFV